MIDDPQVLSQADFARMLDVDRAHITRLKKSGRLVMTDDGLVIVEASRRRIEETADPNRDDVTARHAAQRHSEQASDKDHATERIGSSFQAARAVKEKFLAMQARLNYEVAAGEALPRDMVLKIIGEAVALINTELENIPERIAPELALQEGATIRARLQDEFEQLQRTVARLLDKMAQRERAAS